MLFPQSSRGQAGRQASSQSTAARGSEKVLVVEDEPGVRSLITRILERRGYRVIGCPGAAEALEIFGDSETSFDMMISDVVMPRMSGPELARRLVHADPTLKVLFISGHLGETMESQGLVENSELLAKPFTAGVSAAQGAEYARWRQRHADQLKRRIPEHSVPGLRAPADQTVSASSLGRVERVVGLP